MLGVPRCRPDTGSYAFSDNDLSFRFWLYLLFIDIEKALSNVGRNALHRKGNPKKTNGYYQDDM